ncbi:MAG: hypothetical protein U0L26_12120 [Cellulosilyticum sp.]|nr:hypothetical protein [Cellulosilyticum sp.]
MLELIRLTTFHNRVYFFIASTSAAALSAEFVISAAFAIAFSTLEAQVTNFHHLPAAHAVHHTAKDKTSGTFHSTEYMKRQASQAKS